MKKLLFLLPLLALQSCSDFYWSFTDNGTPADSLVAPTYHRQEVAFDSTVTVRAGFSTQACWALQVDSTVDSLQAFSGDSLLDSLLDSLFVTDTSHCWEWSAAAANPQDQIAQLRLEYSVSDSTHPPVLQHASLVEAHVAFVDAASLLLGNATRLDSIAVEAGDSIHISIVAKYGIAASLFDSSASGNTTLWSRAQNDDTTLLAESTHTIYYRLTNTTSSQLVYQDSLRLARNLITAE